MLIYSHALYAFSQYTYNDAIRVKKISHAYSTELLPVEYNTAGSPSYCSLLDKATCHAAARRKHIEPQRG